MTNETTITVRGWAGSKPRMYVNHSEDGKTSQATTIFNVGVTPRSFNKREGAYQDGNTMWYSVRCYGNLARNVSLSINKGCPVLVRGRLVNRLFTGKSGEERSSAVIMADSIGVELNSGTVHFAKTVHQKFADSQSGEINAGVQNEWGEEPSSIEQTSEESQSGWQIEEPQNSWDDESSVEGSGGHDVETNIDVEEDESEAEFIAVDSDLETVF